MKEILIGLAMVCSVAILLGLAACNEPPKQIENNSDLASSESSLSQRADNSSQTKKHSGIGMSYCGKVGIQIGDSPLIMTSEGVKLGFGF